MSDVYLPVATGHPVESGKTESEIRVSNGETNRSIPQWIWRKHLNSRKKSQ